MFIGISLTCLDLDKKNTLKIPWYVYIVYDQGNP